VADGARWIERERVESYEPQVTMGQMLSKWFRSEDNVSGGMEGEEMTEQAPGLGSRTAPARCQMSVQLAGGASLQIRMCWAGNMMV
jgi:hypothetical protein